MALSLAPVSSKEAYAPPIPSPLNPTSPGISPRRQKRGSGSNSSSHHARGNPRKPNGPMSPTQKLMRRKAAAAWRSMALRDAVSSSQQREKHRVDGAVVDNDKEKNGSVRLAPESALPGAELIGFDDYPGIDEEKDKAGSALEQYHDFDIEGAFEADMEKESLVLCAGRQDTRSIVSHPSELAQYGGRPNRLSRGLAIRRRSIAVAVGSGILCAIGFWLFMGFIGTT